MSDKPIAWLVVSKEGVPVTGESGDLIGCYDHNDLLPGDDYREKRGEHVVAVYTLPPLHQLAPRVVAAWLDARRERMYSGDSETEKIANTTLEFAAHDLRRTSGLSPVVDPPAPAPVAQGERERIKKLDAVVGAGDTAHVAWMMFEDDGGRAEYDRLVLAMTAFRFALDAARKP